MNRWNKIVYAESKQKFENLYIEFKINYFD